MTEESDNNTSHNDPDISTKRVTRRKAISTSAKVATSVVVTAIAAGAGGYFGGISSPQSGNTITKSSTQTTPTTTQTVSPTTTQSAEKPTITVGWSIPISTCFLAATQMQKMYDENPDVWPFKLKHVGFPGSQDTIVALAGGSIDMVTIANLPAQAAARAEGRPIVLVYPTVRGENNVLVRTDSPYKTLADLKGKPVGVPVLPSASFVVGVEYERKQGIAIDLGDFVLKQGPQPVLVERLMKGELEAIETWSPFTSQALATGKIKVLIPANDMWKEVSGSDLFVAVMSVREETAKAHPEAVRGISQLYIQAIRFLLGYPNAAAAMLKDQMKIQDPKVLNDATERSLWSIQPTVWDQNAEKTMEDYFQVLIKNNMLKKIPEGFLTTQYAWPIWK